MACAALDLRNATTEKLANGLTVILLEDRSMPVVSVQMLYRVGARNEITGKTGLAHFLEHMAFRDSKKFPGTELVSRIYAVGGEWHGYTWIDQTTYFATVPKSELDLLLDIEAERLEHLVLDPADMEAERGAVLAELHMYENSPTSRLIDAVNFVSFLAHPYRNNTIGWESDVANLAHRDVVDFYRRHYHAANAILVVVGDFHRRTARQTIKRLFGAAARREPSAPPPAIEPGQRGERRITLYGHDPRRQFMLGYRAPSARNPDFPVFLVLQETLGAGSGVNFLQNDWGTPIDTGSLLHGAADDITTWYPPAARDYVFMIGGYARDGMELPEVEADIEAGIAAVRTRPLPPERVAAAIARVQDELVFDVETTEDAAHQLAFFEGLGALDVLLELPRYVAAVTPGDVQRVARRYLDPERRTIGWHLPMQSARPTAGDTTAGVTGRLPELPHRHPLTDQAMPDPEVFRLRSGIPVILQRSGLSSSVVLQVVLHGSSAAGLSRNDPVHGHSSLFRKVRPGALPTAIVDARQVLGALQSQDRPDGRASADPSTRLEQVFDDIVTPGAANTASPPEIRLIVVAGDVSGNDVRALLDAAFGEVAPAAQPPRRKPRRFTSGRRVVQLGHAPAQAQLGYIAAAPAPYERSSDAHRLLLYMLSHDYEGRLGRKAISDSGLVYYIDSRYRSDGSQAWITLSTGVDPAKLDAMQALLESELERLRSEPPSDEEIREAKRHLVGRRQSAAQSNTELAALLAAEWLWYGKPVPPEALQHRLLSVSRQDILDAVPGFTDGAIILVTE